VNFNEDEPFDPAHYTDDDEPIVTLRRTPGTVGRQASRRGTRDAAAGAPQHLTPRPLQLVPRAQRHGSGGKVIGAANAGPPGYIGVHLPDARHHFHLLGPTGTGKSTLALNMVLDDAANGRGVAVFDPKGDLIRDILDRLPAYCGDRLVIIDPDEAEAPPALNLLQRGVFGATAHDVAAHITSVMSKVWYRWWGHRTADIAHHGLLTLAHLDGSTLAQLPKLLSHHAWRTEQVTAVENKLRAAGKAPGTLTEFWDGFDALSVGHRASLVAPLLAKLRLVLAHPLAAGLFGVPASTFRLADILDGGILLCRLPKGIIGEDGTRLVGSLLLAGLWQATTARARLPEHERLDAAIVVDECHNFLHLPIGLDDALAEARGLRTSFVLAHQYLGQLSTEMAEAIDANARNKVYFALAPRDAARQAYHVEPYLDEGDLTRLGAFEVVLRPIAAGRAVAPGTADTLPALPAVRGRAEWLRDRARRRTGLPREVRRSLLAEVVTADEPADGGALRTPGELVGRDTFRAGRRHESSSERLPEQRVDHERSGERSPMNTPFPQLSDGEEDPWHVRD